MTQIWKELEILGETARDRSIAELCAQTGRFAEASVSACDMVLDYSKTTIDTDAKSKLIDLVQDSGLETSRNAMFSGDIINETEGRAVLHTALRNLSGRKVQVDGVDVMPEVLETLERMKSFANDIRSGALTGATGKAFTDVINIGIGGSDLGPVMAYRALAPYRDGQRAHFVSNIDGAHVADILAICDPETTLVIIASKSFTTIETMTNAQTARDWLVDAIGEQGVSNHLAALASVEEKTSAFGVRPERVFGFEDWVGGRYSIWGPIGLSLMIAIGADDFTAFLQGAEAMDEHFLSAPLDQNMPVMLALIGVWHRNACGYPTRAVLPYEQRLERLPAYLQQLDMESNGKSVAMDGTALKRPSGPVVWGEPGTNGQHAFYQLIHQGTDVIPCEFMVAKQAHEVGLEHQHRLLQANCLAQSEALMVGRSMEEARALMAKAGLSGDALEKQAGHRVFHGNRPSTTLVYDKLTPRVLGQIIALYEHRVFVEGVIWGLNSFDQWGVELGKILAVEMLPLIEGGDATGKDSSTQGLLNALNG